MRKMTNGRDGDNGQRRGEEEGTERERERVRGGGYDWKKGEGDKKEGTKRKGLWGPMAEVEGTRGEKRREVKEKGREGGRGGRRGLKPVCHAGYECQTSPRARETKRRDCVTSPGCWNDKVSLPRNLLFFFHNHSRTKYDQKLDRNTTINLTKAHHFPPILLVNIILGLQIQTNK